MSKKLWGGRFQKETDKVVEAYSESISYDYRLIEYDIKGSIAHALMLGKCGIIAQQEAEKIIEGLLAILKDYQEDKIEFDTSCEDIHMNVEKMLFEKIGDVAGKLHTARSRNDQVCTDVRLYLKDETKQIINEIANLQSVLIDKAEKYIDAVMPGFTHLQHAQPVLLSHHLMAYFWMFERDKERFADSLKRIDIMPLGSGALAGTTFPIDRDFTALELGFSKVSQNSMDSVADRDFISEFLSCCAIFMTHISRFSEEIIIWNTSEFAFIELDDSVTTGSSIMPQKKNPDVAELARGKGARVIGNLMSLLALQKNLPLAYNRDLQEDKEPLFDSIDTVKMTLSAFNLMIRTAEFNTDKMQNIAGEGFSTATDLADHLVRQGKSFRDAHEQVGLLVAYCIDNKKSLEDLAIDEIRKFAPKAADNISKELSVQASVNARKSKGGTAKEEVLKQIKSAKALLK
ncbi:MAG: argininosuccinate lyase [Armatimonadota bacterium]